MSEHRFPYEWMLADAKFTKDKGKVFSCFACGGGSTMGYKLAGFDVIGCNEIDPKMMAAYVANHSPKYSYLEPIQTFKDRSDLPAELFDLDILDGSPPCSSFSMAGNREQDWGKEKKFREGQAEQVLDTLFFDFIDLAKRLQPKVVIAENVKGLLLGNAIHYVRRIYEAFDKAGYECQHFLLDASKMGVPQRRERVFFVSIRKDLAGQFMERVDMFTERPRLKMEFDELEIPFKDIMNMNAGHSNGTLNKIWDITEQGKNPPGDSFFSYAKCHLYRAIPTINGGGKQVTTSLMHPILKRFLNDDELILAGSFPSDYKFSFRAGYLISMSVPPVMTANVATEVYDQWLSKLK
jgi:DNA (cytosine-5)-methyltransferase 1